jgi:alkylated DNA repair dioxygenase AlkB
MELTMDFKKYALGEGKLIYVPHWGDDPVMLYREAKKFPFTPEIVTMFQKSTVIERQTVDFGLPYSYNKTAKASVEWEPLALAIKQKLESQIGRRLMQCACNYYVSPTAYIGCHCDKSTPVNGVSTAPNLIVSLSLGSLRQMALRPIRQGREGKNSPAFKTLAEVRRERDAIVLDLEPGSLVILDGIVNHTWKHAIPQAENKSIAAERISLTFREF